MQSEFAKERAMLCQYIRTDALLGKFFEPFIFEEVPANESDPKCSRDVPEAYQSVPEQLIELIKKNSSISRATLSKQLKISERQVRKIIEQLRNSGQLTREGGDYNGKWVIHEIER